MKIMTFLLFCALAAGSVCAAGGIFFDVLGKVAIDGAPAPEGTVVEAYSESGVLCGTACVRIPGYLGIMHVYADDPATRDLDGIQPGEKVFFRISGKELYASPDVVYGNPYESETVTLSNGMEDTVPPVITECTVIDEKMLILFNEPVNHLIMKDPANYDISAAIAGITMNSKLTGVEISFDGSVPATIVIKELPDIFGNTSSDTLVRID